ncbi:hypothetical protein [Roseiflexus castenholzii]|uniref:Uncharacterized protein n=1 Tax=Roseiflexus castenholzii (strain DSM 13941 / HLO8) TaxID=383372 RepID=A7NJY4_ROSCS|nr:hypothetical protein [Roseiflexus castenholzii]ABU57804.1 hypothetical protein Rcas_1712 [Roseiflexus castenholzii DSM 13941]
MNARLNRRIWRHEGGAEAVEIIALIAVCIALLAAIGLGFNARGSDLGAAAVGTLTRFASEQSLNIGNVAIDGPDVQGPGISPITAPAVGIPRIVVQPPRISAPVQPQQSAYQPVQQAPAQQGSGNPLLDFWNSLTGWVQGAILGLAGAAVAVVAFLGLVAAGVITVASGVVLAAIAAVALAVGAIAGAIYVVATGRVDAWQIVLLGFGAASAVLIPIGLALRFPAVAAFFSSIPARIAALWSQRIAPWVRGVISNFWKWLHDREAVGAWLKKYGLPLALCSRALEEFVKGSYVEGFLIMLIITLVETFAKGNPAAYLVTFLIYPILKGIYGRYKARLYPSVPLTQHRRAHQSGEQVTTSGF